MTLEEDLAEGKETEGKREGRARVSQEVRFNSRYLDLRLPVNQALIGTSAGVCLLFREFLGTMALSRSTRLRSSQAPPKAVARSSAPTTSAARLPCPVPAALQANGDHVGPKAHLRDRASVPCRKLQHTPPPLRIHGS